MYLSAGGLGCCGPAVGNPGLGWFAQAMQVASLAASVFSSKSGGDSGTGHCWTRYDNRPFSEPCIGTPNYDAVVRAVSRMPDADVAKIIAYLLGGNSGSGPKNRQGLARPECVPFWVKAILGGKDCKNSKYPDAPGYFMQLVMTYGAPETPEEAEPGSSWFSGTPGATGTGTGTGAALLVAGSLALIFAPKLFGKP